MYPYIVNMPVSTEIVEKSPEELRKESRRAFFTMGGLYAAALSFAMFAFNYEMSEESKKGWESSVRKQAIAESADKSEAAITVKMEELFVEKEKKNKDVLGLASCLIVFQGTLFLGWGALARAEGSTASKKTADKKQDKPAP